MRTTGGAYWYRNGVNWTALSSLIVGIVAGGLVANTVKWQGFVSIDYLGGADLSPIVGFVVGAGLYYLLTRTVSEPMAVALAPEAD